MAKITINTAPLANTAEPLHVYTDLKLDLMFNYTRGKQYGKTSEVKDMVVDHDQAAIRNSIFNLFNTSKGERVLSPEYGLNLRQFLFTPISDINAELLGDAVVKGVARFEPRVKVVAVTVAQDPENQRYLVQLEVVIPVLKGKSLQLNGIISNTGYTFK